MYLPSSKWFDRGESGGRTGATLAGASFPLTRGCRARCLLPAQDEVQTQPRSQGPPALHCGRCHDLQGRGAPTPTRAAGGGRGKGSPAQPELVQHARHRAGRAAPPIKLLACAPKTVRQAPMHETPGVGASKPVGPPPNPIISTCQVRSALSHTRPSLPVACKPHAPRAAAATCHAQG